MRLAWGVLVLAMAGPGVAMADGLECQANILYGDNTTVRDAATGESVTIVPEPYLPRTQVYRSYDFDLAGGGYALPSPPSMPYIPPAAPYTPPVDPYQPQPEPPMTGSSPSDFLDGTTWILRTVDGQAVTARATLTFEAGGRFGGSAACNSYGGDVGVFDDFTIDFAPPFSTRRACPQLSEEQAYFAALGTATDFRPGREGDTLALLGAGGMPVATFVRDGDVPGQVGLPVVGIWNVAGVVVDGVFETDSGFGTPTIEFMEGGRFVGSLGCNTAQGDYTRTGDRLTFGMVAVTARACFVPAPFEGPILAALPAIRTVQAIGGGISLRDGTGAELIRLTR